MSAWGPLATAFHVASHPRAGTEEIAWYAARLPGDAGPVLELMCGAGRLLVPLLEHGIHVHGVDLSATMLAACEGRVAATGRSTSLFRQDVRELNLPFRYAAAFCAAGSFALLPDPFAATTALARVRAHLIPPALLLLDLSVPAAAAHPPGAPRVEVRSLALPDGSRLALRSESAIDPDARRVEVHTRLEQRRGGRIAAREDHRVIETWYTEDEARTLITDAGFDAAAILPPAHPFAPDRGFAVVARAAV
jgi:hypothetical protein